ncbi:hypothetical protein JL722_10597 [Aureococcus anophagefferens]|nr:hypothetical protein JL722_10597 [Aureococcus anophagefferens]
MLRAVAVAAAAVALLAPLLLEPDVSSHRPPADFACGTSTLAQRSLAAERAIEALGWRADEGRLQFAQRGAISSGQHATNYGALQHFRRNVPAWFGRLPRVGARLLRGLFVMGRGDVVFLLGCTPPGGGVSYASVAPYVWVQPSTRSAPGAQLGPSLNHLELEKQNEIKPWNATFLYVASPDAAAAARVAAAVTDAAGALGFEIQPPTHRSPPPGYPLLETAVASAADAVARFFEARNATVLAVAGRYEYSNRRCATEAATYRPYAAFAPPDVPLLPSACAMTSSDSTITAMVPPGGVGDGLDPGGRARRAWAPFVGAPGRLFVAVALDVVPVGAATLHSLMFSQIPPGKPSKDYYENKATTVWWRAGLPQPHVGAPVQNTVAIATVATHGCPAGLEDATGRPWPCAAPDAPVSGASRSSGARLDPATALAPAATSFRPSSSSRFSSNTFLLGGI